MTSTGAVTSISTGPRASRRILVTYTRYTVAPPGVPSLDDPRATAPYEPISVRTIGGVKFMFSIDRNARELEYVVLAEDDLFARIMMFPGDMSFLRRHRTPARLGIDPRHHIVAFACFAHRTLAAICGWSRKVPELKSAATPAA